MPDRFSLTPHQRQAPQAVAPETGTPVPPAHELDDGPDWLRAIGAIRHRLRLVLAIAIAGSAATVVVARHVRPLYKASATILIASQTEAGGQGRSAQLGPIRQDQLLQWESWIDLLRSYAILDPVVRELRLNVWADNPGDSALFRAFQATADVRGGAYSLAVADDGSWQLSEKRAGALDRGAAGDSIGRRLGLQWALPADVDARGRRIAFHVVTLRTASERLSQAVDARVDRNGAFLRVEMSGPTPTQTAGILNAISARYVQVASDLKRRRLAEFARNLEDQRVEALANLEKAEKDLEQFRMKNVDLPRRAEAAVLPGAVAPAPTVEAADPRITDDDDLDRVRRDRHAIAQWLAAPAASRSPSGPLLLTTSAAVGELKAAVDELARKRADLRALKYRYEDAYPAVRLLAEDIEVLSSQTLPSIAKQLDADLGQRERELKSRVAARTDTLRGLPARQLDAARLERASSLAASLYTSVQQRYQEARLAQASSLPDVWVLDAAVPAQLPSIDRRARTLLLGCGVSLAFALALAIALDRMDPRVRYPAEVSRRMGLAILGAVPHLRARRGSEPITLEAAEEVTEALRAVRMALTYGGSVARPMLLTISSSGPGDGKSFMSSNLGLSFALAGYRTLVIDGDLRRGTLHRAFGTQRRPGLTDCLRGEVSTRDVVQRTPFESLSLIGSGTRTRSAPELLSGPGMAALLEGLKPDYDVIICDSPPLSAGVDPYVLGTLTGQMLLVLRTGVSVRSVLEAKLAVLSQLPVTVLGAVLNDVPAGALYQPYSYYVEGYHAADETDVTPALPGV